VPLAGSLEAIAAGDLGGVEAEADWFEVGGVKLFADGGTSSHTAAFYEDYTDAPGSRGELTYELDELAAMIATAQGASAQVMVHAAGDRAQDQMLDAVERAGGATEAFRHRIEHGANTAWTAARAEKARRLGVIPVPNPGFIRTYGDFWETALGERAIGRIPLKSLFEAGVPVAGNADTTGGDPALLNPLHNMWCAMTRRTITDRLVDPEERLSVDQALTMYTRLAAYVGHSEASRGTLETGKLADIVVLSHAVDDVQPEDFREMRVDHTIIDGRLAYTAPADEAHDAVRRPAEGLAVSPEPRSR
jgi:predicted amidohydrolase YtcJ